MHFVFLPWASVCGGQGPCESELRVRFKEILGDALQIRRKRASAGMARRFTSSVLTTNLKDKH